MVKELREVIAGEQFLNTLPTDIRILVLEREPKSCAAAGGQADTYVQARKSQAPTKAELQQGKRLSNPQQGCIQKMYLGGGIHQLFKT